MEGNQETKATGERFPLIGHESVIRDNDPRRSHRPRFLVMRITTHWVDAIPLPITSGRNMIVLSRRRIHTDGKPRNYDWNVIGMNDGGNR